MSIIPVTVGVSWRKGSRPISTGRWPSDALSPFPRRLMLFPTLSFGLFFLFVFALIWAVSASNEWRKILLLLASWVFYGAWDWRFVALLIGSALLNWGAARIIAGLDGDHEEGTRKAVLLAGVAANLGVLGFFKYYGFFLEQMGSLLARLGFARDMALMEVVLPV